MNSAGALAIDSQFASTAEIAVVGLGQRAPQGIEMLLNTHHHGAGHTSGDDVYHFEQANVVHMGDLLFNRAHPNIDRAAGASTASWITALEGFEDNASPNARLTLGFVLGLCYDELTEKK